MHGKIGQQLISLSIIKTRERWEKLFDKHRVKLIICFSIEQFINQSGWCPLNPACGNLSINSPFMHGDGRVKARARNLGPRMALKLRLRAPAAACNQRLWQHASDLIINQRLRQHANDLINQLDPQRVTRPIPRREIAKVSQRGENAKLHDGNR